MNSLLYSSQILPSSVISFPKLSTMQYGTVLHFGANSLFIFQKSCLLILPPLPTFCVIISSLKWEIFLFIRESSFLNLCPPLQSGWMQILICFFTACLFLIKDLISLVYSSLSFRMRLFLDHSLKMTLTFLDQIS